MVLSRPKKKAMDKDHVICVLDRDGTISYDPGWFGRDLNWKEQLKLLPGVAVGIKKLNSVGRVIVASNQYGVARGYFSLETVLTINKEIDNLLKTKGAVIDNWQVCPFVDFDWALGQGLDLSTSWVVKGDTPLRKPGTGMIEKAAREMQLDLKQCYIFAVGNRFDDAQIGVNAGGYGIIIKDEKYIKEFEDIKSLSKINSRYAAVNNFLAAVDKIEKYIQAS